MLLSASCADGKGPQTRIFFTDINSIEFAFLDICGKLEVIICASTPRNCNSIHVLSNSEDTIIQIQFWIVSQLLFLPRIKVKDFLLHAATNLVKSRMSCVFQLTNVETLLQNVLIWLLL